MYRLLFFFLPLSWAKVGELCQKTVYDRCTGLGHLGSSCSCPLAARWWMSAVMAGSSWCWDLWQQNWCPHWGQPEPVPQVVCAPRLWVHGRSIETGWCSVLPLSDRSPGTGHSVCSCAPRSTVAQCRLRVCAAQWTCLGLSQCSCSALSGVGGFMCVGWMCGAPPGALW